MAAAAAVLEVALEVPDNCKLNKFQQDTAELFQGLEREQLLKWMQSQNLRYQNLTSVSLAAAMQTAVMQTQKPSRC